MKDGQFSPWNIDLHGPECGEQQENEIGHQKFGTWATEGKDRQRTIAGTAAGGVNCHDKRGDDRENGGEPGDTVAEVGDPAKDGGAGDGEKGDE